MKRACYAHPNGELVTPEEFVQKATPLHKEKRIFAYCPACDEAVDPYGLHSPNVSSRFDHKNLATTTDVLDDCILANRNARFSGMYPDDWDQEAGRKLRALFFEDDNVRLAYGFCLQMCRKGNFPIKTFRSAIRRADKKKVWDYAGIKLWVVPYILLTLENFTHTSKSSGSSYDFHFLFDKPKGTTVSVLWTRPRDCRLKKVFSNSGMPVKASDNPFPVSEQALREKAGDVSWITGDVSWITGDLLRSLKACA